jgi:Caspase domain
MRSAQRKALIIGISDYTNLQKLGFCKNDGTEIYQVLNSLGYEISDKCKLVGEAKGEKVKDAIYDFFDDIRNIPDDTLLFYYSGHGVPDVDGDMYLASSDTDPDKPYRKGFSFEELTKMIQKSISTSVVVILDCCYSGSAKVSKGHEEDAAKTGSTAIDEKSRKLPLGQGKYILSASQAAQEAYALETGEHSIFTYYLLQGLRGNTESVDSEGNVTPQSLGKYVYRAIMSLPADKRPRQKPITRAEESGDVILASYDKLRPVTKKGVTAAILPPDDSSSVELRKYQFLRRNRYRLLVPIVAAAIAGIILLLPTTVFHPNHANNITSIIYNAGSNNGSQTAMADMQIGRLFNPACDPTGVHASGGQHPTPYCNGWTSGYISAWNDKHPGWTSGYISAWKPNNPPANGTILSCQQCGSKLKPIIRYINGSNDGGQAALSNIQNGNPFNPACDPTRSHTSDGLHTTEYCNGWTNGYISAWNTKHTPSSVQPNKLPPAIRNVSSGMKVGISNSTVPVSNMANHKKALPTLALICKNKSGNSLICTYTNGT